MYAYNLEMFIDKKMLFVSVSFNEKIFPYQFLKST